MTRGRVSVLLVEFEEVLEGGRCGGQGFGWAAARLIA
jgi:hypothetical protein